MKPIKIYYNKQLAWACILFGVSYFLCYQILDNGFRLMHLAIPLITVSMGINIYFRTFLIFTEKKIIRHAILGPQKTSYRYSGFHQLHIEKKKLFLIKEESILLIADKWNVGGDKWNIILTLIQNEKDKNDQYK